MRIGRLAGMAVVLLIAAPVGSAQGAERTAGAAPVLQEHGEANAEGYSCSTGIVIRWAHVKGIDNYTLTFYDGHYKSDQSLYVSPPYDDRSGEYEQLWAPKGTHQKGWTGGVGFGYGAPPPSWSCKADPGYYGRVQNPKVHWTQPGTYIDGTVTGSCPPEKPLAGGGCPVQGVKIRAAGKGARSAAKRLSDSTDSFGNYSLKVAPGRYEVTASKGALKFAPRARKVKVAKDSAARADFAVKDDTRPKLSVKVVPQFPELNVDELPDGTLDPASTKVEVTVTNSGKGPAKGVTLEDLAIAWDDDVKPPKPLPLVQLSGPDPESLGDIAAGASVTSTYAVEARGDGRYELTARATGTDEDGKKLAAKGSAKLKAQSPILFVYTRPDRSVPSPDAPELIKAGTALAIRVRLRNRSYRDTIVVHPFQGGFAGNLVGGYLQPAGKPIQDAPGADDIAVVNNSGRFYVLKPRQELALDAVYRTGYSNPETGEGGGGTRGAALFSKPAASTFDAKKGKLKPIDPEKIALAVGAERHELSIDDRPPEVPPFDPYAATLSFSIGAAKGLAYSVAGTVKGIFYDLPVLIGTAGRAYVQLVAERYAELWEAVRDDEDSRNVFQRFVAKQKEFMLRDLEIAGKVPAKLKQALNAAFEQSQAHLNTLNNKWYTGDWLAAAEELGTDTGQLAGDVALADVALGKVLAGLPRLAKVAKAADAAKAKALARVRPAVEAFTARAQSAVRSVRFLAQKVKPGYVFDFEALEVLYGMTHAQARFLAVLAKTEGILIACRSRGAGAIKWIEKFNAYVKPEWIKTKNVNKYDIEYLGYLGSDLDRVVIKTDLPSDTDVIARLDADGVTDAEVRRQVLDRLKQRQDELASTEYGSSGWILEKARSGEVVETRFNWKDNGLDPYAKGKTTKAKFTIADEPPPGNLMVSIDGGPSRPITGDLDLVALTKADSTPLSNAAHERILRALQGPPLFLQHPETATWHKKGQFDFAAKHNELRKDLPVQFAPDGQARMVKYVSGRSFFQSKLNYFIHWDGGYRHLDWLKVPGLGRAG